MTWVKESSGQGWLPGSQKGKRVLLPWEPENNAGVNLGQKDDLAKSKCECICVAFKKSSS